MEKKVNCPDCGGSGVLEDWDGSPKRCGMCDGLGFKIVSVSSTKEAEP